MKDKKILVSVLGILGILLTTVGVTFAFFSYSKTGTKENSISSGKITFLYTEAENGITLVDAMPMTDVQGKTQSLANNVFDFNITSTVGSSLEIPYTVTAKVDNTSTLSAEYIKLYLTDQNDNELEPIRVVSTLEDYTHSNINISGTEKVIYEGIVPRNSGNYSKLFRLRMWIADNIDMNSNNDGVGTYNATTFKIKINVYSGGNITTEARSTNRANADISSITINGINANEVDATHYESSVNISGAESSQIPINVTTSNPNATVRIDKVNSVGKVISDEKVKKISLNQNITINRGTNYYKITVRPEDKSDPTTYYLTIVTMSEYAITYNLNGGTNAQGAQNTYLSTNTYILPTPTKLNSLFEGWYENSDFSGSQVNQISASDIGNKTYYAKWYSVPTITISSSQISNSSVQAASNQQASVTWNIKATSSENETYSYKVIDYYNQSDKRASNTSIANGSNYSFTGSYEPGRHLIVVQATGSSGHKTYESFFFIVREYGNTTGGLSGIAMNGSQTLEVEDPGIYDSNNNPLSYTSGFDINIPSISGHSSGNADTFNLYGWDGNNWVKILNFNTSDGKCRVIVNDKEGTGTWQSSGNSGTFTYPQQTYYKIKFVYWNAHANCVSRATNSASYSVSYQFMSSGGSNSNTGTGNDSSNINMESLFEGF